MEALGPLYFMKDKSVQNLSNDQFHELACNQDKLFPDLLYFCDENEVIDRFYEYYKRTKQPSDRLFSKSDPRDNMD